MIGGLAELEEVMVLDTTHHGATTITLCKHKQQGRFVVVKAMRKDSLKDTIKIQHAHNQKESLQLFTQLKTKGVSQIVSTLQDHQRVYLVLEMAEGLPLHKLLKTLNKLSSGFVRIVMSQIGLILRDFHAEGWVYRDVKASNFMVSSKGAVTMVDLGLAKQIGKEGKTTTLCGTTHSMAPQMYESPGGYGYEVDHYAFGVLLYELLTGVPPFGYGVKENPNIKEDMFQGITAEKMATIECPITRDLIRQLLAPAPQRLGNKGGMEQVLQHDYFNVPEFSDAMDIRQGEQQLDKDNQQYRDCLSEIEEMGLDKQRFQEVTEDDPFYKFFSLNHAPA